MAVGVAGGFVGEDMVEKYGSGNQWKGSLSIFLVYKSILK
jgi:hypothetical protein